MSKNNEHGILNKRAAAPPRAIAIITPVDLSRLENESSCDATNGNAIIFNRMAMQLSFRLDALKFSQNAYSKFSDGISFDGTGVLVTIAFAVSFINGRVRTGP
jgi:hypothetical protein